VPRISQQRKGVRDQSGGDLARHQEEDEQERRGQGTAVAQQAVVVSVMVSRAQRLISRPTDGSGYVSRVQSRRRLALAAAGLALVAGSAFLGAGCGSSSGSSMTPAEVKNTRAVGALVAATSGISTEMDRQHKLGGSLGQKIKQEGLTPANRAQLVRIFEPAVKRFTLIRSKLKSAPLGADPLLAKTQRTLSLWLSRQIEVDTVAVTARTNAVYFRLTKRISRPIARLTRRLEILSPLVQKKYPGVDNWKFLPNSTS
jgi:hypothetical protein